jgi:hypothetical protein
MVLRTKLVLVGAMIVLTGCLSGGLNLKPGPVRFYEGPEHPADSVALIENDPNMYLASVDGHSLRRWTASHDVVTVQVLPGNRTLVAGPSARSGYVSMDAVQIQFLAEAGHRYVVSRRIIGSSAVGGWVAVFTDVTTGKELFP